MRRAAASLAPPLGDESLLAGRWRLFVARLTPPFIAAGIEHRTLIWRLAKRDIDARYRGSWFGILWAVLTPLAILGVYTFVFSVILEPRWPGSGNRFDFALRLFLGITFFQFVAAAVSVAPDLIRQHGVYVKRLVFPLDVLPYVTLLTAAFDAAIALLLLLYLAAYGLPPVEALLLPLTLLPLALVMLGTMWFISTLGVFIRDLSQIVRSALSMLLFLSAIFYPLSAIPAPYHTIAALNPLATLVDVARTALFDGAIEAFPLLWFSALGLLLSWTGHAFFQRARGAFADVI